MTEPLQQGTGGPINVTPATQAERLAAGFKEEVEPLQVTVTNRRQPDAGDGSGGSGDGADGASRGKEAGAASGKDGDEKDGKPKTACKTCTGAKKKRKKKGAGATASAAKAADGPAAVGAATSGTNLGWAGMAGGMVVAAGAIATFPVLAGVGFAAGATGLVLSMLGGASLLSGGAAIGGMAGRAFGGTPDANLNATIDRLDRLSLYTGFASLTHAGAELVSAFLARGGAAAAGTAVRGLGPQGATRVTEHSVQSKVLLTEDEAYKRVLNPIWARDQPLGLAERQALAQRVSEVHNRVAEAVGENVVPRLTPVVHADGRASGWVSQPRVGGRTFDQLGPAAQANAGNQMENAATKAETSLGLNPGRSYATEQGITYNVDRNRTNFRFDENGNVTSWFDPVVVQTQPGLTSASTPLGFGERSFGQMTSRPAADPLDPWGSSSTVPVDAGGGGSTIPAWWR